MTFEIREESDEDGAPIELYSFTVYGQSFHYTSASEDQEVDAVTYKGGWPIDRSKIDESQDLEKQNITLTVAQDFPILAYYDDQPPSDVITLRIKSIHRGDTEAVSFWNGRVMNGIRRGAQGVLHCENIYSSMRRFGLRRPYSRLCPHVLYGNACGISETSFKITVGVDAVGGIEIQSAALSAYADGRFAGGMIKYEPEPGRVIKRGIKAHVGDLITVTHPVEDLEGLDEIDVFLGCKHTLQDCDETFDNSENYGGWPYIPRLNPMGQSSVF